MPEQVIKCSDCDSKREEIEEGGVFEVVSCEPLEGEEDRPMSERKCKIIWRPRPI